MDTDVIYAERYSLNYNSDLNCRRHNPQASTWLGGPPHDRVVPGLVTHLLVDLYSAEPRRLRAD